MGGIVARTINLRQTEESRILRRCASPKYLPELPILNIFRSLLQGPNLRRSICPLSLADVAFRADSTELSSVRLHVAATSRDPANQIDTCMGGLAHASFRANKKLQKRFSREKLAAVNRPSANDTRFWAGIVASELFRCAKCVLLSRWSIVNRIPLRYVGV